MKSKILISLSVVLFFSCLQLYGQQTEYKEGFYPDGSLRYKGNFKGKEPVGEVTHYYPDGNLKAIMDHNGKEAKAVLYSQDGEYTVAGKYADKKRTGEWVYRLKEKVLMTEEYKDNQPDGKTCRYFENGEIAEVKTWKNGVQDGPWVLFYDNGKVRFETTYVAGKLHGKLSSFSFAGSLEVEGEYAENKREGVWRYYDAEGEIRREVNYIGGVPENKEEEEMKENREIDEILKEERKIIDPANFINDPQTYMRFAE